MFDAQLRTTSKKIQELVHINLGLPQQTSECSNFDGLVKRNDATPTAAPHHHMAAVLANRRKTQPFQRANDLPSGKVRELRHGRER
jgi:hypothetical protein